MAASIDILSQYNTIIQDIEQAKFRPVYLLMGTDAYYPELICDKIISSALNDDQRDFNQNIVYGNEIDADSLIMLCRAYPMMSDRRLVVVKNAQSLHNIDRLGLYFSDILESTILVLLMQNYSADKRKTWFKELSKIACVFESNTLKDYQVQSWITAFYKSKSLNIDSNAALLLQESVGNSMQALAQETEKIIKNIGDFVSEVRIEDIEANVGLSREVSVFELTKALSYKEAEKALKLSQYISSYANFKLFRVIAVLFLHFYRILKYHAMRMDKNTKYSSNDYASELGINPFFLKEYDRAIFNYPVMKCINILSIIEEYDFKAKGGESLSSSQEELLKELIVKLLN